MFFCIPPDRQRGTNQTTIKCKTLCRKDRSWIFNKSAPVFKCIEKLSANQTKNQSKYCQFSYPVLWPYPDLDRKSTRLNSSHLVISYAVFCLKKNKKKVK